MIKEPSNEFLIEICKKLSGVQRVILAGGEPTLRHDLPEIAWELSKDVKVVAMASNAVLVTPSLAAALKKSLAYVDITIDGTREIHDKIRGQYNEVLRGIRNFVDAGVDVSMVSVLLTDNVSAMLDVCKTANELSAKKLKILTPIRKGRGANIVDRGLPGTELETLFNKIRDAKEEKGWKVRITLVDWEKVGEGHAILIHPDGEVVASPVPSEPTCIKSLGNLTDSTLEEIWKSYPYKRNHVDKYLEDTLYVC